MTKTLFMLPGVRRSPLSCVWIDTGNPQQPLACVWIDDEMRFAQDLPGHPREVSTVFA